MKIKYEFVTGETVEVEVNDSFGSLYVEMERIEENEANMLSTNLETYGSSALSCEVKFYSIADLQEMTGWSEKTVQKLFCDPEFPATDFGRTKLVEAHALINYFSTRRTKNTNRFWK